MPYPFSQRPRGPIGRARRRCVEATQDFERIFSSENLLASFHELQAAGGTAPGIDGLTFADLGPSEAAAMARQISQRVRSGEYEPLAPRLTQIQKQPLFPGGPPRWRQIEIPSIGDRCVSHAVHKALSSVVDNVLSDRCFGFRPKRGIWHLLLKLERDINESGNTWLVQGDIQDAFNHVRLRRTMNYLCRLVTDPRLLDVIATIVRFDPGRHVVGLSQGDCLSPMLFNLTLHHVHDCLLMQDRHSCWYRYADNIPYLCASRIEATERLDRTAEFLAHSGMNLRRPLGSPVDLRQEGTELLGLRMKLVHARLVLEVSDDGWSFLDELLAESLRSPTRETPQSLVRGWIESYGPALGRRSQVATDRICSALSRVHANRPSRPQVREWIRHATGRWERLRHSGGGE